MKNNTPSVGCFSKKRPSTGTQDSWEKRFDKEFEYDKKCEGGGMVIRSPERIKVYFRKELTKARAEEREKVLREIRTEWGKLMQVEWTRDKTKEITDSVPWVMGFQYCLKYIFNKTDKLLDSLIQTPTERDHYGDTNKKIKETK